MGSLGIGVIELGILDVEVIEFPERPVALYCA
jgi:hypothetical protein